MNLKYIEDENMEVAASVPEYVNEIHKIINRGGPDKSEFKFLAESMLNFRNSSIENQLALTNILKSTQNANSMIGHTFQKPYGYAGDFELIHRIYTYWKSNDQEYRKWDELYHWADSATAVRNRKDYIIHQLNNLDKYEKPFVLNLGSGPCTDIHEYFLRFPKNKTVFDCIDMDQKAIQFASGVCDNYIDSIRFHNVNVFHYRTDQKYNLIWSAGLFDYFNDKLFIRLIRKYYSFLAEGGEMVIGNFSTENPSRGLMEVLCQWYLNHRTEEKLIQLAIKAGITHNKLEVKSEPTGINLFLHIKK